MAEEKKARNLFDEPAQKEVPKKDGSKPEAPKKAPKVKIPGKKGKWSKVILLTVLLFVAGSGAGAYFMFGKKYIAEFLGKKPVGSAPASPAKKEAVGPILQLDPFVFNLSGNQAKYAKISLGIEVRDVKAMEETKKMVPLIRDKVLSIFGTKAPEVLMDVNQREMIKKEVHTSLKAIFKNEDELKAVYITDIIIQ
ncbi:MAG: flagellar basal body-associated FliL family protein [Syntrophorhabdaceae bacterium]